MSAPSPFLTLTETAALLHLTVKEGPRSKVRLAEKVRRHLRALEKRTGHPVLIELSKATHLVSRKGLASALPDLGPKLTPEVKALRREVFQLKNENRRLLGVWS